MYSYEERKKADDLYIKYGKKASAVINDLGVNAGEKFPDFASLKFPLSGKKIY